MSRVASVMLALAIWGAKGRADQAAFRSGVDVVRVDALITDGRRPIAGLQAADFELRDNGVLQAIDSIAIQSLPLTVTFVLDTSGSVAGDKMAHLSAAVDSVLQRMREQDRAALITFSHRIWQPIGLTSDWERLRQVLAATGAEGGTALNDAVYAGLALGESQGSRSLVLVFSDGMDNASWLGGATVEHAAQRADAVVYGVTVAASTIIDRSAESRAIRTPQYLPGQTEFLERIAVATGGRVIKADTTMNVPKTFEEILKEFRTRYQLTYSPRGVDTPGWHAIDLKVKARRTDVKARRGYERP